MILNHYNYHIITIPKYDPYIRGAKSEVFRNDL